MIYKKIITLFLILLYVLPSMAIEGDKETTVLDWAVSNLVLIVGLAVIVGASIALYNAMKSIWLNQNITSLESSGMPHAKAVQTAKQDSFLSYIYRELAGGVPLEQEADVLLNHDYDGIRELDNNLPPWWVGMFYISILFAGVYMVVYHFSDIGLSQAEEYKQEVRNAEIAIAAFVAKQKEEKELTQKTAEQEGKPIDEIKLKALTDIDRLAVGEVIFKTNCSACHGKLGEGMLGLGQNLTDKYWIHGGGIENIFKTVSDGVPSTTMVPWKNSLDENQLLEVSSYILTLQGTNPPNAREPEGELWKEVK